MTRVCTSGTCLRLTRHGGPMPEQALVPAYTATGARCLPSATVEAPVAPRQLIPSPASRPVAVLHGPRPARVGQRFAKPRTTTRKAVQVLAVTPVKMRRVPPAEPEWVLV